MNHVKVDGVSHRCQTRARLGTATTEARAQSIANIINSQAPCCHWGGLVKVSASKCHIYIDIKSKERWSKDAVREEIDSQVSFLTGRNSELVRQQLEDLLAADQADALMFKIKEGMKDG